MRWAGAVLVAAVTVGGVAAGVALSSSSEQPAGGTPFEDFRVDPSTTEQPLPFDPDDAPSMFIIVPSDDPDGGKERYQGHFCAPENVERGSPAPPQPCPPPSASQTPLD